MSPRSTSKPSTVHAEQPDVVIIGGGMVGLGLACALNGHELKVLVLERREAEPRYSLGRDCRVSAIVAGNVEVLQGLGVWPYVTDAEPIRGMRIWDDQHVGSIRFDAAEIGQQALGYIVENSRLQAAMQQVLAASENVEIRCPVEVEQVRWGVEAAEVRLHGGQPITTPLVVGADGGHSWLRRHMGIGVQARDYRQQGIVSTIRPEQAHRGMAFQRFLPTGPLALLPLSDDLCSIVWSAEDAEAERLMALPDAAFAEELYLSFGPLLGRITEVGERAAFPLRMQLAAHLVRPRLALVGDAAHTIHPLAGLGVNLGLRDAMVLAQEIVDASRFREDWGDLTVLERYLKTRLPDLMSVMGSMEALHQLFTHQLPGLPGLRGMGMRLVGNSGPVKRLLMRNSTGLALPLPRRIV
jgi:ubiquinone biosynthesis UbiH/UbiF/VisC/COQ6 family hydroxylase